MKKGKNLALAVISMSSLASQSHASPPRGPEVRTGAGGCNIGPFRQETKAGEYNVLCNVMPDTEKCFAYLKQRIKLDGTVESIDDRPEHLPGKMQYCIDKLSVELGIDE